MSRGKFVVLEGGPGSGKTSFLQGPFRDRFKFPEWTVTYEPGGTPFGDDIRNAVQGFNHYVVSPRAELLAYNSSRANLCDLIIRPKLNSGDNVISDRYWFSTFAYQGAREIPKSQIVLTSLIATNFLMPDLVLYFDIDAETGQRRKKGKADLDRLDVEGSDFFKKVHKNYQTLSKVFKPIWEVIDASKTQVEVADQCFDILARRKII